MTSGFSVLGAALVGLACLLFGRSYAAYVKARVSDYTAVLEFLELMRREISCRLATPAELASRAARGRLAEIGFLDLLAGGESLGSAFRATSARLALDEGDMTLVCRYFDGFGGADLEGELRTLDAVIENLTAQVAAVRADSTSQIKLARALSVLLALGTIILLL